MDKKDYLIIKELRENSRISIKKIAKKTKIRPSTVHQRIHKLIRNETIEKFTVKLNNKKVEENFIVFVLIKTNTEIKKDLFDKYNVKEVFGVTGQYDLILKLKFKDVEDFNDFILDLRKVPGIKETLTMVSTKTIKEEL